MEVVVCTIVVRCEMLRECPILVTYYIHTCPSSPYLHYHHHHHHLPLLWPFRKFFALAKLLLVHDAIMIFARHAFPIF